MDARRWVRMGVGGLLLLGLVVLLVQPLRQALPFMGASRSHTYQTCVEDVAGLRVGTEVTFRGLAQGSVTGTDVDEERCPDGVVVEIEIDRPLAPGEGLTLTGLAPAMPPKLRIERCGELPAPVPVARRFVPSCRDLPLETLLGGTSETIAEVKGLVSQVELEKVQGVVDQVAHLVTELEKLGLAARIGEVTDQTKIVITDLGAIARTAGDSAQRVAPEIEAMLRDARRSSDVVAAALGPIVRNLEDVTRNLAALSRELRENPVGTIVLSAPEDEPPPLSPGAP